MLSGPLAMVVAAIVALTATLIYTRHVEIEAREGVRLEAIAESRAREIGNWLKHRAAEAEFLRGNPRLHEMFHQWQNHGDQASLGVLLARAIEFRKANEYAAAFVLDAQAEIIAREGPAGSGTPPALKAVALKALATGQTQRTEIYRVESAAMKERIDFAIPLTGRKKQSQGVVVLRVDPLEHLFPLLRQWPVETRSGESVLVRRDGERIVNMSKPALNSRIAAVPAAERHRLLLLRATQDDAVIGRAIDAIDSSGTSVLGAARRVAGSDWILVARINRAEFLEQFYQEALWIALGGLLLCMTAVAVAKTLRTRDALALAVAERDAQAVQLNALKLLDLITGSSTDAIFAKDSNGRYLYANNEVCRTTGRSRQEIIGQDDIALFGRATGEPLMARDAQTMRENRTVEFEESVETMRGPCIYHSTKGPIHDARGDIIGMYGISREITERKRNERALLESRTMLQTVQDSLQNQMAVLDHDGRIIAVNAAWSRFGLQNAAVAGVQPANTGIGVNYIDICRHASGSFADEAEQVCDGLRAVLRGENTSFLIEYPCHSPTANRWFLLHAVPLTTGHGGAVVVHTETTERKHAEQLQREQNRVLEMVAAEQPLAQTLEALAHGIEFLAGDVLCSILLIDETGSRLRHGAAPSLPDEYNRAIDGIAIGPGVGSCGTAAHARAEVIVEDILTHPHWRPFLALAAPIGLRACWSTPVFDAQKNLLGTFAIYRRSAGAPTPWHRQLIDMATHVASICITTARARSALVSSESQYRSMVAALNEGLVLFDDEGHVLAANPAAERLFGMTEAEIIARWRDPRSTPQPIDEAGRCPTKAAPYRARSPAVNPSAMSCTDALDATAARAGTSSTPNPYANRPEAR